MKKLLPLILVAAIAQLMIGAASTTISYFRSVAVKGNASVTSQLANNATNVALVVDTAVPWTSGNLAALRNAGTNQLSVSPSGSINGVGFSLTNGGQIYLGTNVPFITDYTLQIGRTLFGTNLFHDTFRDASIYSSTISGGYASYDSQPLINGTNVLSHVNSFQARPHYAGSLGLSLNDGFTWALQTDGPVNSAIGFYAMPPSGVGPITNWYGFYAASAPTNATSYYFLYNAVTSLPSYHGGVFQTGTNIASGGYVTGLNLRQNAASLSAAFGSGTPTAGSFSTFGGVNSGNKITGGLYNTFYGEGSGANDVNGGGNLFFGAEAGFTSTTTSNFFIGNKAGKFETGSNKFILDNVNRASEADARTNALMVGLFDAFASNQTLLINAATTARTYTIQGATNQVTFGATNTPPVSSATPTKWISVTVSGDSGVYRLPLYE